MKWTEEMIRSELLKSISTLGIKRMPTASELKSIGRNDLHVQLGRTKTYRGWANEIDLPLKSSTTTMGQFAETLVATQLNRLGYEVEQMSTKHPYDLLVNSAVKIDVKIANPCYLSGSRVHVFRTGKKSPTCDIYVCIARNEHGEAEKTLIIPSHHLRIVTLSIGKVSEYDRFMDRWDYISNYAQFYERVV